MEALETDEKVQAQAANHTAMHISRNTGLRLCDRSAWSYCGGSSLEAV